MASIAFDYTCLSLTGLADITAHSQQSGGSWLIGLQELMVRKAVDQGGGGDYARRATANRRRVLIIPACPLPI
jgi:hypothetical protein